MGRLRQLLRVQSASLISVSLLLPLILCATWLLVSLPLSESGSIGVLAALATILGGVTVSVLTTLSVVAVNERQTITLMRSLLIYPSSDELRQQVREVLRQLPAKQIIHTLDHFAEIQGADLPNLEFVMNDPERSLEQRIEKAMELRGFGR